MKIAILILHIVATICFGACAIISANVITEILYVFSSVGSAVCIGLDIADLISGK